MLQGSQILKNTSSFVVITDTVAIEKATMITNTNQRDKSLSDKENRKV